MRGGVHGVGVYTGVCTGCTRHCTAFTVINGSEPTFYRTLTLTVSLTVSITVSITVFGVNVSAVRCQCQCGVINVGVRE